MIILGTNSIKDTGYDVDNSCRFNDGDGANMNKSYGGSTDTNFTFSAWIKRGDLGNTEALFSHWNGSNDNNRFIIYFEGDSLVAYHNSSDGSANDMYVKTTAVYRDPSAWYHFVVAIDTTQGVAANRVKIYTNGVLQTSLSQTTYPAEDYAVYAFHSSGTTYLGRNASGDSAPTKFFDGYMAEVFLIDGTTYAASNFGEYDSDSPTIWKPKDCKDDLTFGTNGTYLDFEDSGNLGDDESGNGNDLTETNIDATDQATDTCTNNFSTLNPLATSSLNDLSQANVKVSGNSSSNDGETFSTFIMPNATAKWYWEIKCTNKDSTGNPKLGFIQASKGFQLRNGGAGYGGAASGDLDIMVRPDGKTLENGSTSGSAVISTWDTDDVLSFALDSVNGAFYVGINGTWQTSGNPESGASKTGAIKTWTTTDSKCDEGQAVCIGSYNTSVAEANFGSPSFSISSGNADGNGYGNFEYAVPSGYLSLCTKNLGSDGG
nr:spry domain protein [uncultured Mediterranean phage uvMED]